MTKKPASIPNPEHQENKNTDPEILRLLIGNSFDGMARFENE
jgi:hypothetical protein